MDTKDQTGGEQSLIFFGSDGPANNGRERTGVTI